MRTQGEEEELWFSFNLSNALHWYTVYIVFVLAFCFPAFELFSLVLIDWEEKETCASYSANLMQVRAKMILKQFSRNNIRYITKKAMYISLFS